VEVEAFAAANLAAKIEAGKLDVAPIWTDIKTFDGRPFRNRIHIITAGYPCQGESTAGKRLGKADPRWLWPDIERIIEAVRPVWFFGENVSGHLTVGFPAVYRSLRLMGYKVEAGLFTAAECGAPHKRERLFILAYRPDSGCKTMQIQQEGQSTLRFGGGSLADTTAEGLHKGNINQERQIARQGWPAQPGQLQYEWEEPRVVVNASRGRCKQSASKLQTGRDADQQTSLDDSRKQKSAGLSGNERQAVSEIGKTGQGQTQSKLGRAVDGASSRVDRLRLLGNGVVPQQAEKAFRELMRLFEC